MEVRNARAIVTGAASGLGQHFALELARAGATVAAGDIEVKGLERLLALAEGSPGRIWTARLDVSQEASVTAFVKQAAQQLDGINVVINNAGILRDGVLASKEGDWIKKLPTAQWKQVLDVNLTGPFLVTREAVADALLRDGKELVVVNISSISHDGNPGQSNYSASKAGLDACTRTWALELAKHGVRVGGVAPGVVDTPMLKHISNEAMKSLIVDIPLGRIGKPEEIWLAVKFIIECEFFTGRVIEVDGGASF
ncbi:MAG TPA: SDR family oxidoreductase [Terriglobales bacterium]|nr:SDR family oxidoreductase [Terriglobales bacterium]